MPAAAADVGLQRVHELVAELEKHGSAKANNAVKLIAVLADSRDQDVLKAAIQALKLFFVDVSQQGDMGEGARKQRKAAEPCPSTSGHVASIEEGSAEEVYRQWLRRQYGAYTAALRGLLRNAGVKAATQMCALSALMEAVRCEQGVGTFAFGLYCQLITMLVMSTAVQPEVLTFLFTRYFQYTDVRYYTLLAVRDIASERVKQQPPTQQQQQQQQQTNDEGAGAGAGVKAPKARKGSKAAPVANGATASGRHDGPHDTGKTANGLPATGAANGLLVKAKRKGAARGATSAGLGSEASAANAAAPAEGHQTGDAPPGDVARTLFDVLANVPEGLGPFAGEDDEGRGGEGGEEAKLVSWCGIEQAGGVRPALDPNLSAKLRRKRKAQEQQGQGTGERAGAGQTVAVWAGPKAHRRVFGEAWLAFLQLPIPADILRKVLLRLHSAVLPRMTNPLRLSDFLTYSLNQGGITGMLALNAIFVLVTQHGLEYPRFYDRLYQLLTPQAFAAKHRAQFFRLADLFLSSGLVPAYTAAAFIKKMARLGLSAPPSGAMAAIAFIHNLIRRHPACMVLLHKPTKAATGQGQAAGQTARQAGVGASGAGAAAAAGAGKEDGKVARANGTTPNATASAAAAGAGGPGEDVYDVSEPDPGKSRAVESSLWELGCYRNHYCPQVSALCAVLDKDLTDRVKTSEVDVEPLLATSYTSLFTAEAERRLKQVPLAFYDKAPVKLFDADSMADFKGWAL